VWGVKTINERVCIKTTDTGGVSIRPTKGWNVQTTNTGGGKNNDKDGDKTTDTGVGGKYNQLGV